MSFLKNYITVLLLGLMLSFSNEVNSQNTLDCSYPEWIDCHPYCTWVAGDICSYDDKDWQLGTTVEGFREPGSQTGPIYWVEISDPCTGLTKPSVEATLVRANYCTTSFGIGEISSNGGATITRRGFVYGTTSLPTIENDLVLLDASTAVGDEFEGLMDNLTPETDYYVRTYAENTEGIAYGTQATFTTRATSDCVADCDLACDMSDSKWLDPDSTEWTTAAFKTIGIDDTVCITQDVNITSSIILYGMFKMCNNATVTLTGGIDVQTKTLTNPNFRGQVVYEGCNEIFDGIGSYTGEYLNPPGIYDPIQMISYCSTCDEQDESQFFKPSVATAYWNATCRPTSTLLLPVELIAFDVSLHEEGVLLEWLTGSETNNSHFEIESSYDGVNWFKIGISQGAGYSIETNNYSFIDNGAQKGSLYYRLKQVDFDGTSYYSNIKYFSFEESQKQKGFIAFQNSNDQIEIQAKFNGMGEALLVDARGRIVEIQTFISTNKSGTQLTFNSTDLATGVYFVKIKSGNALLGEKVQVLK